MYEGHLKKEKSLPMDKAKNEWVTWQEVDIMCKSKWRPLCWRKWDIVELIQQHEGNESWLTLYKDRSTYY